jgi:5'-methylthioadenosine phosphorylase
MNRVLGIIGGSGLYELEELTEVERLAVDTPFGSPSDAVVRGRLGAVTLLFLPRHGQGHRHAPHRINYRANVFALKKLGAEQLLSVSAVGSLRPSIRPGDFVLVDQFIDRTRNRASTFFDDFDLVAHVGFGDPVDGALLQATRAAAAKNGVTVHVGGTYVCMEGPQFSTRAESNLYRSWGADVIGMTNLTEAKLAREAEICYATMALVTDYDCWHPEHDDVDINQIMAYLRANAAMAQTILRNSIKPAATRRRDCACVNALQFAIMTDPTVIPPKVKDDLAPLIGKYIQ